MPRLLLLIVAASVGWSAAAERDGAPPLAPLKPAGFTAEAILLAPRAIGDPKVRKRSVIAVHVLVRLEDFQPRGMEPTLVINGVPHTLDSGVVAVDGRTTVMGFVVDDPGLLAEGATLALQMGEDAGSRVPIPGSLRRGQIKPLDPAAARKARVPSLKQWLESGKAPRNPQ